MPIGEPAAVSTPGETYVLRGPDRRTFTDAPAAVHIPPWRRITGGFSEPPLLVADAAAPGKKLLALSCHTMKVIEQLTRVDQTCFYWNA